MTSYPSFPSRSIEEWSQITQQYNQENPDELGTVLNNTVDLLRIAHDDIKSRQIKDKIGAVTLVKERAYKFDAKRDDPLRMVIYGLCDSITQMISGFVTYSTPMNSSSVSPISLSIPLRDNVKQQLNLHKITDMLMNKKLDGSMNESNENSPNLPISITPLAVNNTNTNTMPVLFDNNKPMKSEEDEVNDTQSNLYNEYLIQNESSVYRYEESQPSGSDDSCDHSITLDKLLAKQTPMNDVKTRRSYKVKNEDWSAIRKKKFPFEILRIQGICEAKTRQNNEMTPLLGYKIVKSDEYICDVCQRQLETPSRLVYHYHNNHKNSMVRNNSFFECSSCKIARAKAETMKCHANECPQCTWRICRVVKK